LLADEPIIRLHHFPADFRLKLEQALRQASSAPSAHEWSPSGRG
jgi:hypothetical protein